MERWQKVQQLINAFNELYPDAEFTTLGHIILSDDNLEDKWLKNALDRADAWLTDKDDTLYLGKRPHLKSVMVAFFNLLLLIPENERVVPDAEYDDDAYWDTNSGQSI